MHCWHEKDFFRSFWQIIDHELGIGGNWFYYLINWLACKKNDLIKYKENKSTYKNILQYINILGLQKFHGLVFFINSRIAKAENGCIWSKNYYLSINWWNREAELKRLESFEMSCYRWMLKIKCVDRNTNEKVLDRIKEANFMEELGEEKSSQMF